ncbi:MAG: L2 protein [Lutjanus campechanus-associated papillomavirus 1]|uniref:L2 protein n=1 Tax=Lutjanus campechanus-associated papillomavirus 1 TaxID=2683335 RepID=A0A8M0GNZ9_9PAPI|nr:MAG: L2 protein [Lutjanus campechanus-associated papillomavirus 1]
MRDDDREYDYDDDGRATLRKKKEGWGEYLTKLFSGFMYFGGLGISSGEIASSITAVNAGTLEAIPLEVLEPHDLFSDVSTSDDSVIFDTNPTPAPTPRPPAPTPAAPRAKPGNTRIPWGGFDNSNPHHPFFGEPSIPEPIIRGPRTFRPSHIPHLEPVGENIELTVFRPRPQIRPRPVDVEVTRLPPPPTQPRGENIELTTFRPRPQVRPRTVTPEPMEGTISPHHSIIEPIAEPLPDLVPDFQVAGPSGTQQAYVYDNPAFEPDFINDPFDPTIDTDPHDFFSSTPNHPRAGRPTINRRPAVYDGDLAIEPLEDLAVSSRAKAGKRGHELVYTKGVETRPTRSRRALKSLRYREVSAIEDIEMEPLIVRGEPNVTGDGGDAEGALFRHPDDLSGSDEVLWSENNVKIVIRNHKIRASMNGEKLISENGQWKTRANGHWSPVDLPYGFIPALTQAEASHPDATPDIYNRFTDTVKPRPRVTPSSKIKTRSHYHIPSDIVHHSHKKHVHHKKVQKKCKKRKGKKCIKYDV